MSSQDIYAAPLSELEAPRVDADSYVLASRWSRICAWMIDSFIGSALVLPMMYLTGWWDAAMAGELSLLDNVLLGASGLLTYCIVNGHLLATRGQSIGKYILEIRIVGVDTNEILPLWRLLALRYLPGVVVAAIPVLGSAFGIVNGLFFFRRDKRCVHDWIAGTRVIRV